MGLTISGSYSYPIVLAYPGDNPFTITSTGTVTVANGTAVTAPGNGAGTNSWTIDNAGYITAGSPGSGGIGIQIGSIGAGTTADLLTNESGGIISGFYVGVQVNGDGTLVNSGAISASVYDGIDVSGVATIVNNTDAEISGYVHGIYLGAGGSVTNSGHIASATASGNSAVASLGNAAVTNNAGGLIEGWAGVQVELGIGTLFNSGTIDGSSYGVLFGSGGSVSNGGTITASDTAIKVTGAAGTIVNTGTGVIVSTSSAGVDLRLGGSVSNSGTISGYTRGINITGAAGTVTNSGTIKGTGTSANGIVLASGGTVNNTGTGFIQGRYGVLVSGAAGTVTNVGTILGTLYGVKLFAGGSITNTGTGRIAGVRGIVVSSTAGTVINAGTIIGTTSYGILFGHGGIVDNTAGGLIEGNGFGVRIIGAYGADTVSNAGTIRATNNGGAGVELNPGGRLVNSDLIEGGNGVLITSGPGTLSNAGTILGTSQYGVYIASIGNVTNTGTGLIEGYNFGVDIRGAVGFSDIVSNAGTILGTGPAGIGIRLFRGGTVIDSGTISGAGGTAVSLGGTGNNLLVLQNGYKLTGTVTAAGTANTLELLGTAGGAVTVHYGSFATSGFQDFLFGPDSYATLEFGGTGTLGVTISGFDQDKEAIDLTGISNGSVSPVDVNNRITVTGDGGAYVVLQLDGTDASYFAPGDDGFGGTTITACFCRGTLIRTPRGEVPVESLAIGNKVVTQSGLARPIKWIGRRAYDPRFVAGNKRALPIRIAAGALGNGVPARDLYLSPEHAMAIDGVLVPADLLVNGTTVTRVEHVDSLEYFHIELDTHDILFAEGAAAESYVDCDNRLMFANAEEYARLYPEDEPRRWAFCAARPDRGSPELAAIRERLAERATALGYPALDLDPEPRLVIDGRMLHPNSPDRLVHRFEVPAGAREVWLVSRSAVPAYVEAGSRDTRLLGLPIASVVSSDGERIHETRHGELAACEGFHQDEATHCWTDGRARVPPELLRRFGGRCTLEVRLIASDLRYPVEEHSAALRSDMPPQTRPAAFG